MYSKNRSFASCKKLIFDIETTGLPEKVRIYDNTSVDNSKYKDKFVHPSYVDKYKNARVIELSYIILNEADEVDSTHSYLIYNPDIVITNSDIHNITDDLCKNKGVDIATVLSTFENHMNEVDILIAHNIEFDFTILLSELYRAKKFETISVLKRKILYCTMINGSRFLNQRRYIKLIELYKHFYNDDTVQTHRALDDVMLCFKCYLKIKDNQQRFSIMDYHDKLI